tara:strand:- start:5017 stop:5445 length:429 start_codon:yes stop_codon:yes gene_type:complete
MSFIRHKGKTKTIQVPVTTSTAFNEGDVVSYASGYIIPATSSTTALSHVGVIAKTIAATDSDYATARLVPVEVPLEKNVEWLADVTSGLVAADVGLLVDLTDAATIDRAASTIDAAQVRSVISTTQGTFVLNLGGSTGMVNG